MKRLPKTQLDAPASKRQKRSPLRQESKQTMSTDTLLHTLMFGSAFHLIRAIESSILPRNLWIPAKTLWLKQFIARGSPEKADKLRGLSDMEINRVFQRAAQIDSTVEWFKRLFPILIERDRLFETGPNQIFIHFRHELDPVALSTFTASSENFHMRIHSNKPEIVPFQRWVRAIEQFLFDPLATEISRSAMFISDCEVKVPVSGQTTFELEEESYQYRGNEFIMNDPVGCTYVRDKVLLPPVPASWIT